MITTSIRYIFKIYISAWFLIKANSIFLDDSQEAEYLVGQYQKWSTILAERFQINLLQTQLATVVANKWTIARVEAYIMMVLVIVAFLGGCCLRTQLSKVVLALLCLCLAVSHASPSWVDGLPDFQPDVADFTTAFQMLLRGALVLLAF